MSNDSHQEILNFYGDVARTGTSDDYGVFGSSDGRFVQFRNALVGQPHDPVGGMAGIYGIPGKDPEPVFPVKANVLSLLNKATPEATLERLPLQTVEAYFEGRQAAASTLATVAETLRQTALTDKPVPASGNTSGVNYK